MPVAAPKKPVKRHPMARFKYGAWFRPVMLENGMARPMQDWEIERDCHLHTTDKYHPPEWLGKAEHFRRMISCIFASPIAKKPFQWNPNAVRIVDKYFEYDYTAIAGHASSSKTETCAIIALGEFLAAPQDTAVLVTSTSISDARGRIWGRIEFYWQEATDYFRALGQAMGGVLEPPGVLISSSAMIRFKLDDKKQDDRGVKLVPGKESEVKEGIGRMKGFKAPRMIFLADELSDLSHKLLEAAESNLFVGNDYFKMVGCFNPNSHFDPAGVFSEPKGGWSSVNMMDSDGWETKRGYCIRFDGQCSPNVVARMKVWEGLITYEKLEKLREDLGDNSPSFMAMCRGLWSETGHKDSIYSEAEIINSGCMLKVDVWNSPKTVVGGFDPSFQHGGDRAALVIGHTGEGVVFSKIKKVVEVHKIVFLDENLDTKRDKREQILANLKSACQEHGLDPKNLAIDSSGGGASFVTLMNRDPFFAHKYISVGFGEQASEMSFQGKAGKDKFVNRASELWYAGKPLILASQIRGLKPDIIREMTLRLYETIGGSKQRIKIEEKEAMKKRLGGRSPDTSDAFFLMVYVCRFKYGLRADGQVPLPKSSPRATPTSDPFSMPRWGEKQKPRLNEPDYIPAGGGWGDESAGSFGGMFG